MCKRNEALVQPFPRCFGCSRNISQASLASRYVLICVNFPLLVPPPDHLTCDRKRIILLAMKPEADRCQDRSSWAGNAHCDDQDHFDGLGCMEGPM